MSARVVLLFTCAAAFAQLPPPQAPPPRIERSLRELRRAPEPSSYDLARVDVSVLDLQGRPVPNLTAADFSLEADGKPQSIESCQYRTDQPLRLAVVMDDLSLSLDRLDKARRALREFFGAQLRPGDEAVVLRSSSGAGALDRFTSDKAALAAGIDRARYNPESETAPAEAFTVATLGALRGVLEGMVDLPGRKAVLLISDRLRDAARINHALALRLTGLANRASAVFFAVDAGDAPEQPFLLEQGVAAIAKDTGGLFLDAGAVAKALDRIAQQQAGHYVLTYAADGFSFDYLAGAPRVSRVAVRVSRKDVVVRARNGVYGSNERPEGQSYRNPEHEFERSIGQELVTGGVRVKLTGLVTIGNSFVVDAFVHVDARDITFRRGLDGLYHATLDTEVALYGENGVSVKEVARTVEVMLGEERFRALQTQGFDYTVSLALPRAGCYQVRAVTRDDASGRIGSARQFLHATNWSGGHLVMSSIVLRGEVVKGADGVEHIQEPDESGAVRIFRAGRQVIYTYSLFNVAADAQHRSSIQVQAQIFRDGIMVLDGDPKAVEFAPADDPGRRAATGVLTLRDGIAPGLYILRLRVTDKVAPRTAIRHMDFEVRP